MPQITFAVTAFYVWCTIRHYLYTTQDILDTILILTHTSNRKPSIAYTTLVLICVLGCTMRVILLVRIIVII